MGVSYRTETHSLLKGWRERKEGERNISVGSSKVERAWMAQRERDRVE